MCSMNQLNESCKVEQMHLEKSMATWPNKKTQQMVVEWESSRIDIQKTPHTTSLEKELERSHPQIPTLTTSVPYWKLCLLKTTMKLLRNIMSCLHNICSILAEIRGQNGIILRDPKIERKSSLSIYTRDGINMWISLKWLSWFLSQPSPPLKQKKTIVIILCVPSSFSWVN